MRLFSFFASKKDPVIMTESLLFIRGAYKYYYENITLLKGWCRYDV